MIRCATTSIRSRRPRSSNSSSIQARLPTLCCSTALVWPCWAAISTTRWSAGLWWWTPPTTPAHLPHLAHAVARGRARAGAGAHGARHGCCGGIGAFGRAAALNRKKLCELGRSLILRLIGLTLLLLLIVQAAGFAVVRATIERNARAQIAQALDLDENVWRRLLEQNADKLRQGSALLAADYGFRSAVNSGDEETIQSVLENHGNRIGAAVTALLGTDLELRAVSLAGNMEAFPATLRALVPPLAAQPQGSQIAGMGGVPYQFVMVPLRAPAVIGWGLMGFPVNQPLADEMRQLLAVPVGLVGKGGDGKAKAA